MQKVLGNKKAIMIFVIPALIVYALVVIVPIIQSIYYSLMEWNGYGAMKFVGIKNYIELFMDHSDGFVKSIYNSLILVFLSLFVQLPIALFFALALARGIKGEKFFRTVYFIPVILSTVVIGQLWNNIYDPRAFGLLNTLLEKVGLGHLKGTWLGSPKTALICALIPIVWQYIGQHMLLMYAGAKSIAKELYEAAQIDGATERQIATKITIPLMAPVMKVSVTWATIGSLKAFDLIYILTRGGPIHASEVPSMLMFSTIFDKFRYGYGSSMAVFIVIECLLLTLIIQRVYKTESVTN